MRRILTALMIILVMFLCSTVLADKRSADDQTSGVPPIVLVERK